MTRIRPIRALVVLSFVAMCCLVFAPTASAASDPTVTDPDDTDRLLDIRSVTATVTSETTNIRLVFWNAVPPEFLVRHAARVEMRKEGVVYGFRFAPNAKGWLRVRWGEEASNCCNVVGALHPDPYTYTSRIHTDGMLFPLPTSFRGVTTLRLDCQGQRKCGIAGGPIADRTVWAAL